MGGVARIRAAGIGPVARADIRFGNLTVFVGPQATGKSVFLQILKLIADKASVHARMRSFGIAWSNDPGDFLDLYFGGGMSGLWRPDSSRLMAGSRSIDLAKAGRRQKDGARPETLFFIPAQRVTSLRDGTTRPFTDYRAGDPFVLREFSERLHWIVQNELGRDRRLFPQKNRLTKQLRRPLEEHVFGGYELRTDAAHRPAAREGAAAALSGLVGRAARVRPPASRAPPAVASGRDSAPRGAPAGRHRRAGDGASSERGFGRPGADFRTAGARLPGAPVHAFAARPGRRLGAHLLPGERRHSRRRIETVQAAVGSAHPVSRRESAGGRVQGVFLRARRRGPRYFRARSGRRRPRKGPPFAPPPRDLRGPPRLQSPFRRRPGRRRIRPKIAPPPPNPLPGSRQFPPVPACSRIWSFARIRPDFSHALRLAHEPRHANAPRWDYGIGYRPRRGDERAIWVEVHPASTSNVAEVLAKLGWLRRWLSAGAAAERGRAGHASTPAFAAVSVAGPDGA